MLDCPSFVNHFVRKCFLRGAAEASCDPDALNRAASGAEIFASSTEAKLIVLTSQRISTVSALYVLEPSFHNEDSLKRRAGGGRAGWSRVD